MIEDTSVLCYWVLCFNWLAVRRPAQLIVSIRAGGSKYQLFKSSCRHLRARLLGGFHQIYI